MDVGMWRLASNALCKTQAGRLKGVWEREPLHQEHQAKCPNLHKRS